MATPFSAHQNGYISLEAAEQEYGVIVRYLGQPDQIVRMPALYTIDEEHGLVNRAPTL